MTENGLCYLRNDGKSTFSWEGNRGSLVSGRSEIKEKLLDLNNTCYFVQNDGQVSVADEGQIQAINKGGQSLPCCCFINPLPPEKLGSADFRKDYNVKYAYQIGSMANGISSEKLVIAMGKAGLLSSFGSAGLSPKEIESAIYTIQQELPQGPYLFNLIHSPSKEGLEKKTVEMYLQHGVTSIEASAFLDLSPSVVYYRVAGLKQNAEGDIEIGNKIIAKISRPELALKFLQPPPEKILQNLTQQKLITSQQAEMASHIPMADDITMEADSGGHTDGQPMIGLLPLIIELRDQIQQKYGYKKHIRVGAAGGIGTPQSALAVFMMGADYVVTGSINQCSVEAGISEDTKELLTETEAADTMMAPSADMFESGVKVQVLKRKTFFPLRAQKLYDLYRAHKSIDDIPKDERVKLEKQIFRKDVDAVWQDVVKYLKDRSPERIARAEENPKRKMSLIFRWYLSQSSNWAKAGTADRAMDYQIWCGRSMASFNSWVKGTYLEPLEKRNVVDIAHHIMKGAAYLFRIRMLEANGFRINPFYLSYKP